MINNNHIFNQKVIMIIKLCYVNKFLNLQINIMIKIMKILKIMKITNINYHNYLIKMTNINI